MDIFEQAKRIKPYLANLSVYFLASLVPMFLSLVSNPFVAKNMSPCDYAIVGYYSAFITLFTPFVNFYFVHYFTKRFYEVDASEREKLKATIFKSFISLSFVMTLVAILLILVYYVLANKSSEIPFLPYALLALFRMPLSCIYSLELIDFKMRRQSKPFFYVSVANSAIAVSLMLLFVVAFKWGAFGHLSSSLLAHTVLFAYILHRNRHLLHYPFDWLTLKEAAFFCWPMVIAAMLTFFSQGYDKVILERSGDLTTLGYYSVGISIAAYINMLGDSVNSTFQPDVFESIVKRNFRRTFNIIALKIALMCVIVVAFIILAPYIIDILTFGRYLNSTKYAVIASLAAITSMMYYSVSQITIALGYSSVTLTNKIVGSLMSVLAFNVLISSYGAVGAAWGVVLSYFFFFFGNVIIVTYKYRHDTHENRNPHLS